MAGIPVATTLRCPRCKILRSFVNVDGGVTFRCAGCEWTLTLTAVTPTGVTNATRAIGALTIPVASGGASFTSGMQILYDTGTSAEVVTATATGSATSIPVTALIKAHNSAVAIGQLAIGPAYAGVGQDQVPNAGGWGY
jgi:spore coat protein U-like protein